MRPTTTLTTHLPDVILYAGLLGIMLVVTGIRAYDALSHKFGKARYNRNMHNRALRWG